MNRREFLISSVELIAGVLATSACGPEMSFETSSPRLPEIFSRGDGSKPFVALTIDDDQDGAMVQQALDIARQKGVRFTFFPVGNSLEKNAQLWQRAVSEGHEIGNHTFNHINLQTLSDAEIMSEIQSAQDALDRALGYHYQTRLLRLPYGRGGYQGGDPRIISIAQRMGYSIVMWSVDASKQSSSDASNGDIVILHAQPADINSLGATIDVLKGRGLTPTTVSGLFAYSPQVMQTPKQEAPQNNSADRPSQIEQTSSPSSSPSTDQCCKTSGFQGSCAPGYVNFASDNLPPECGGCVPACE